MVKSTKTKKRQSFAKIPSDQHKKSNSYVNNSFALQPHDLRHREGICVIDVNEISIPKCPHGPCLLFSDGNRRWFACAVYRNRKYCGFVVPVSDSNTNDYKDAQPVRFFYGNGLLRNSRTQSEKPIHWCLTCSFIVELPHQHPVEQVKLKLTDESVKTLDILPAIQTDDAEAQYWFSKQTQVVIGRLIDPFDSILAIGCPSVFENFRKKKKTFLLDFDYRFSHFFLRSEFAHYSMLNHHFYQTDAVDYLTKFFTRAKQLVVLVDPPFGVMVSALQKSLQKIKNLFDSVNLTGKVGHIVFLPLFSAKHLKNFNIVDYKVTYDNHKLFKYTSKTIVRMFTDMDQKNFVLPTEEGYRYCNYCERYISKENRHCEKCQKCTTTFGATFDHCDQCGRCVKAKFRHCAKCTCCHLPNRCFV